jgi:hypothetical protein
MPRPKKVQPLHRPTADVGESRPDPSPEVVEALGWSEQIVQRHKSIDALDGAGRQIMGSNGRPVQQMVLADEKITVHSALLSLDEAQLFDKAGWKPFSSQWTRKALGTTGMRRLVIDNDVYEAL